MLAGPSHTHLGMSLGLSCGNGNGALTSVELHDAVWCWSEDGPSANKHFSKKPYHSISISQILQLVIWNSKTLEHSPERRFLRTWWFAVFIRDSSRHGVPQCQSRELLWHLGNTTSFHATEIPYPCGNVPMQWLHISYWFLTIRVPKWLGLRNLQISEANTYFLPWSRGLVNLVVMNKIVALDAAVLRWDPSVPSMFGSSLAIAWSDRLSAKQPQMCELASRLVLISNLSKIPTETVWVPQHQFPWFEKLAWQNATQTPCKR